MRILHVITGMQRAAGTSVFVGELAKQQAVDGHDVAILVRLRHDTEYPLDGRVKIIAYSPNGQLPVGVDVLHVHALWDPWLTKMARVFKRQGVRTVWSPHGMLTPWALKNKWFKKALGLLVYQYWSLQSANILHATADTEKDDIRRLHLHNQIVIAPLGVHVKDVGCSAVDLGLQPCTQKYICFVSRIQRKKGLPNLLRAWARLPDDLKIGWKIKIAGPDEDNHQSELKALCKELKIVDSIEFLGPVYGEIRDRLYANAAFSVLPTYSENFGSVVIESLAQGTPVICTKGAPWQDLETWNCGWWIDIGVAPLARALEDAMSTSTDALKQLGQNGRALVKSKYTWSAVAGILEKAYES